MAYIRCKTNYWRLDMMFFSFKNMPYKYKGFYLIAQFRGIIERLFLSLTQFIEIFFKWLVYALKLRLSTGGPLFIGGGFPVGYLNRGLKASLDNTNMKLNSLKKSCFFGCLKKLGKFYTVFYG